MKLKSFFTNIHLPVVLWLFATITAVLVISSCTPSSNTKQDNNTDETPSAAAASNTVNSDGSAQSLNLASLNPRLVKLQDGKLVKFSDADLASKKYVAFYYSAHWCPPCVAFTPKLVRFYNEAKKNNPDGLELIFVSSDMDEKSMLGYMEWAKMTFPAINYSNAQDPDIRAMEAEGIPYLLVVDQTGQEVLGKGTDDWIHPEDVLTDFQKLLK